MISVSQIQSKIAGNYRENTIAPHTRLHRQLSNAFPNIFHIKERIQHNFYLTQANLHALHNVIMKLMMRIPFLISPFSPFFPQLPRSCLLLSYLLACWMLCVGKINGNIYSAKCLYAHTAQQGSSRNWERTMRCVMKVVYGRDYGRLATTPQQQQKEKCGNLKFEHSTTSHNNNSNTTRFMFIKANEWEREKYPRIANLQRLRCAQHTEYISRYQRCWLIYNSDKCYQDAILFAFLLMFRCLHQKSTFSHRQCCCDTTTHILNPWTQTTAVRGVSLCVFKGFAVVFLRD